MVCDTYEVPSDDGPRPGATLHPFPIDDNFAYEGDYIQGRRHGQGVMTWPRLSPARADRSSAQTATHIDDALAHITTQYRGQFVNDKAQGFGEYRNGETGRMYSGEWADGKAHGYGEHFDMKTSSSYDHHYRGQWRDGLQHGYGEEFWGNGDRFSGEYRRGRKHGPGQFRWHNREIYQGEFLNDELSGLGQYYWADGRVSTGVWRDSRINGTGLTTWPVGNDARVSKWYNGEYVNNKRHGKGTYHFADGREYTGDWFEGKLAGQPNNIEWKKQLNTHGMVHQQRNLQLEDS